MSKPLTSDVTQEYCESHAVEIMKMLNEDRKTDKTYCDGVVQSEGKEFPVHKCVVGVVSDVLGKMFVSEMREKYENVVKINNLAQETVANILDFVYTGGADLTDDNVCNLLEGADYTHIPRLTTHCTEFLMKGVCAENCVNILAYAQRYNIEELRVKTFQTAADNLATVVRQEDFPKLKFDEVSTILAKGKEVSEEAVLTAAVCWVNYNAEERENFFVKLFSLVNPASLSRKFVNCIVKSEPLVFNSLECMQHLFSSAEGFELVWKKISELSLVIIGGKESETNIRVRSFKPDELENLPNLNVGRIGATVVKRGHHVYVIGGGDKVRDGGVTFKSVEMIYLLEKGDWKRVAEMVKERQFAASALLNGFIYVSGGWGGNYWSSCEKYDCDLDEWTEAGRMLQARGYHAMVELKGSLYCVGGTDGGEEIFASVECYDKVTDTWKNIAPMNKARRSLAAVAFNGRIYATGGTSTTSGGSASHRVERYDPEKDEWTELRPLNVARCRHGACVSHEKIYVFGGNGTGGELTSVEVYDEASDTWEIRFDIESCPEACTVIAV